MPFPGPVRQIGYVVNDFNRALASLLEVGVGPWYVMRGLTQHVLYRGAPCRVTLSLGLANTGDMQGGSDRPGGHSPSIYREFLTSGREGFHQFAWWVTDFDSALVNAEAAGWPVVWSGEAAKGVRDAYVEPSGGLATVYEIMELTALTSGFNKVIRDAADSWDGTDPIRAVG